MVLLPVFSPGFFYYIRGVVYFSTLLKRGRQNSRGESYINIGKANHQGGGVAKALPSPHQIAILMCHIILNVYSFTKLLAVFLVIRSTRKREQWTYMYFLPKGEGGTLPTAK